MSTIELSEGDALLELNVTLRDSNTGDPADPESWDVVDLSGSAARLDLYLAGESVPMESFQFSKVNNGVNGEAYVPRQSCTMTAVAGTYYGEIVITTSGLETTIQERIKFRVKV
jgi:hypothetical protein